MDWQRALLSKTIHTENFLALVNARITTKFFPDPKYAKYFEFMEDHWRKYGVSANLAVMHADFPSEVWEPEPQPIEFLIDQLRTARRRSILLTALTEAATAVNDTEDPKSVERIEQAMQDGLVTARLEVSESYDLDFTQVRTALEQLLDDRQADPGHLRGISTGFPGIDFVTGGLQAEQFVVIFGKPKSLKSATLLYMSLATHLQAKVPMFLGFEMSNMEQHDRLLSLLSGVSLTKIMTGNLSFRDRKALTAALVKAEAMRPYIFSSDTSSALTVSGIQAKIQQYQPDAVFIDGMYLLRSDSAQHEDGSPQSLTAVSRSLKRLAQHTKIPIVGTTQASIARSKNGLDISSGAYSQAWGQDADIVLGTERMDEQGTDSGLAVVKFKVIASRSGPRKEVFLEWDWSRGSVAELNPTQFDRSRKRNQDQGYDDDDND